MVMADARLASCVCSWIMPHSLIAVRHRGYLCVQPKFVQIERTPDVCDQLCMKWRSSLSGWMEPTSLTKSSMSNDEREHAPLTY